MEKIIEQKSCKSCQIDFSITDKDLEFYEKASPVFGGKKYGIPAPNFCPNCREQKRFSFRNERSLYKRICDATGKPIISMYSPDKDYVVYDQDVWWSDAYNPIDYGQEIDFNKSFFTQYEELFKRAPKSSIQNAQSINSQYTNYSHNNKNCHLLVGAGWCEDSYYGYRVFEAKDTIDSFDISSSENNYECIEGKGLYGCMFCRGCIDCSNLSYSEYCINSHDCYGCINLVGKKYHILNKEYSKEGYEKELINIKEHHADFIAQYNELRSNTPVRSIFHVGSTDSSGDQLINCKNCSDCYHLKNSEDIKYSSFGGGNKDSQDINFSDESELQYHCTNLQKNYKVAFGFLVWMVTDGYYLSNCMGGSNLFLCTGIKDSQYCILNKQYTKQQYEELVPKIIEKMKQDGEWGEYFPVYLSPFGYNETVANDHFPLEKEIAISQGLKWNEYTGEPPQVEKVIPASGLPEKIENIPDDILNWAIECEVSGAPFRILPGELEFYRRRNLPIPRKHPDTRHLDRMKKINPRILYQTKCDKCKQDIQTTYAPERVETIYCEECYNKEIY